MTLLEARELLKRFDCNQRDRPAPPDYSLLRQALLLAADHSDYQLLGICADTLTAGIEALHAFTQALGYTVVVPQHKQEGAVYLKFNPRNGTCYVDAYTGSHRGVLVSCQSADDAGINEMYGHLPLNLFS